MLPHEMVFLDDSGPCVAGAREAGLHAVRYQNNAQALAEIKALLDDPATSELSGCLRAIGRSSRPAAR